MKKVSAIALLFGLGLFAIGCEPADTTTTDDTATPAAPETPAPAEGT